ncbi:MAG TPA: hypothetical protein VEA63_09455, partial [Opitutus sp.]|nr:hypothetical protein [Opitutus sp.]
MNPNHPDPLPCGSVPASCRSLHPKLLAAPFCRVLIGLALALSFLSHRLPAGTRSMDFFGV